MDVPRLQSSDRAPIPGGGIWVSNQKVNNGALQMTARVTSVRIQKPKVQRDETQSQTGEGFSYYVVLTKLFNTFPFDLESVT